MSLFTDHMILKLLELIKISKDACYKINMQKCVVFLYTNNKPSERKIKKTIPLTSASKRIPRNKFNQRGRRPVHWKLQDTDERALRHKWMDTYSMPIGWDNQY